MQPKEKAKHNQTLERGVETGTSTTLVEKRLASKGAESDETEFLEQQQRLTARQSNYPKYFINISTHADIKRILVTITIEGHMVNIAEPDVQKWCQKRDEVIAC